MPIVTHAISGQGPILPIFVAPSLPYATALRGANLRVPNPVLGHFLLDTGASSTVVGKTIISSLGLFPIGQAWIHTPSTAGVAQSCNQFDVLLALALQGSPQPHIFSMTIPVIESDFSGQGIDGLIGRDILSQCLLVYNGPHGHISISV